MTSGLGGGSLVDPQVTDPGLTMPLLQFENMSDDELDDLMRHQKIERYEFDPMQRGPMGESGAFGTEDEEVVVDEETGLDMTPQATTLGGGYRGGEGMMMPEGGRGGEGMGMYSEGGYGGEGYGGYGGEGYGGEGGYGARQGMGPMMGEGGAYGQMASFGPGQLPDPEDFPEYKMFRYIDLNVRPNVTYQYKLELLLEDPNDPNPTRGAAAPPASSLDFAVVDRLKSRPEPPKWVASMGLDRIFYRETEASEPSKAVKVTDGRQLIVGKVMPADDRAGYSRPGSETTAKVMALEFDHEKVTNVPGIFDAHRGTVGTLKMTVEWPDWPAGVLRKVEEYQFKIDAAVMDLEGGKTLLKDSELSVPGKMLVLRDGKMSVVDEMENSRLYERFDFPEEDNMTGPGYGEGMGGGGYYGEGAGRETGGGRRGRGRRGGGGEGGEGGYGGYGGEGGERGGRGRPRGR